MKIKKNLIIFIVTLVIGYALSPFFGLLYLKIIFPKESAGLFIDSSTLIGLLINLPLSLIFTSTISFCAFGDKNKYWWIGVLLTPALLFELYFDLAHIYFPIILGIAGWLLGKGAEVLITKFRAQKQNLAAKT